jgi:hypothetical protein
MSEQAVSFPLASPSMIGVYCAAQDQAPGGPTFVWLNAGLIPRIGPNRLYVRLARESARLGLSALRFDLSGIGDSSPRTDGAPFRQGAVRDVHEALEYLSSSRQATSFVLAGLCSGADLAMEVAKTDARIVGLILIDGLPYPNLRSRANRQLMRVRRALAEGRWRRLFSRSGPAARAIHRLMGGKRAAAPVNSFVTAWGGRDVPPLVVAASDLSAIVARGAKILVIFTEGREYNYNRQFADLFPSLRPGDVQVEYFEGTDHTFNLLANQDRLSAAICSWSRQFVQSHPCLPSSS